MIVGRRNLLFRWWSQAQNLIPELMKLDALQRLCKEIRYQVVGGAVFDAQVVLFYVIRDKEISDIQMAGTLASAELSILLKLHRALIVPIHDVVFHIIPLCLQKQPCP